MHVCTSAQMLLASLPAAMQNTSKSLYALLFLAPPICFLKPERVVGIMRASSHLI
jgi:hypothetical protein